MMESFARATARLRNAGAVVCLMGAGAHSMMAQTTAADDGAVTTPAQTMFTPLTEEQRLHNYLLSMVGPMTWVTGAASAGWGQLRDRPEEWGQGGSGFGRRMASGFAQRVTRETLIFGASSLLHEDNRYLASTETTTGARIGYALESTFLARKDDGTRRFSFSRIGGMAGSSLISRAWQPPGTRSMRSAGLNFGTSLAVAAGFNVAREFMPRKLRRSK